MQDPQGAPPEGGAVSPPPASQQQPRTRTDDERVGREEVRSAVLAAQAVARPARAPAPLAGAPAVPRIPAPPKARSSEAPSIQVGPDVAELRHALDVERAARVGAELRAGTLAAEREELVEEREKHLAAMARLTAAQAKLDFDLEAAENERDRLRLELDALIADRESQNPRSGRLSLASILGMPPSRPEPPAPAPVEQLAPPPPAPPPSPSAPPPSPSVPPPQHFEVARREAEPAPPRPPEPRSLGERAAPPVFLALAVGMLGAVYTLFPRRIEIAEGPVTLLERGAPRALHVERVVGFGQRRPAAGATWASADPRVADVDAEGRVLAVGPGKTRVEAREGGLRAAVEVTVRLPARLSIKPAAITLDPDHPEAVLEASLVDAEGAPWSSGGAAITWSSSAEAVAVVSAGKVKRAGPGAATLVARHGELRAEVAVTSLDRRDALSRGCDAGAPDRCAALARLLDQGDAEVAPDHAAALALFQKACDGGAARACAELGTRAEAEAVPDLVKIAAIYQKACDAKDAYGCARLGRVYETGLGVVGSSARALALYRAACDAQEPEGCYRLGVMIEQGHAVARDAPAAVELYKKACAGNLLAACAAAGNMYFHGSGSVGRDVPAAVALYDQACDGRHEPACTVMALNYKSGEGVEADAAKSVAYFAKACAAGSKAACVISAQR